MTKAPSPTAPPHPTTTVLGRTAEARAQAWLERAGLVLVVRNYRCRVGEIDLVMFDPRSNVLVFVEVRSRSRADFGSAAESIGYVKQRRCWLAANHLLVARRDLRRMRARFDVVALDPPHEPGGEPQITWIRNAFALD